jgi:hypothetical protein
MWLESEWFYDIIYKKNHPIIISCCFNYIKKEFDVYQNFKIPIFSLSFWQMFFLKINREKKEQN